MCAAKSRKKKTVRNVILFILLIVTATSLFATYKIFGPATGSLSNGEYLFIRTGATYEDVKKSLSDGGFIRDITFFDALAKKADYPNHVRAGRYHIEKGMSNYKIVRMLRSARQEPVKLVVNKFRMKQDFVRFVAEHLEADSNVMKQMLNDNVYLAQFGLDTNTALCAIMPDTYEFWWNTSADNVFRKIEKNYVRFWTEERKKAAAAKGLKPAEVVVMASIVDEETNNNAEKPTVASVYLNRLKKGMKLGADPTAKYAYGDFTIKRVTAVQTSVQSPYNTYQVTGLPPGPICTPSGKSIDAVLFAPATEWLFFCANTDGSGTHLFAKNYEDHLKNAKAYHDYQDAKGNK